MHKTIIGVMGPGIGATDRDKKIAYDIGKLIAKEGWAVLSGGRNEGVMEAVNKGAKSENGLTIGILPTSEKETFSDYVDIVIITDMNSARNNINVLSSSVVVVCGLGAGSTSEIALAIKANKDVILINIDNESLGFFKKIGKDKIIVAETPQEVINNIKMLI